MIFVFVKVDKNKAMQLCHPHYFHSETAHTTNRECTAETAFCVHHKINKIHQNNNQYFTPYKSGCCANVFPAMRYLFGTFLILWDIVLSYQLILTPAQSEKKHSIQY